MGMLYADSWWTMGRSGPKSFQSPTLIFALFDIGRWGTFPSTRCAALTLLLIARRPSSFSGRGLLMTARAARANPASSIRMMPVSRGPAVKKWTALI